MIRHPFSLLFGALGLLGARNPATLPVPRKYRLELKTAQVVNLAAFGQGQQRSQFNSTAFVSLDLADSAQGRVVRLVLDSIVADSASPIPKPVLQAAAGSRWHGFLEANGRMKEFVSLDTSVAAQQFAGLLRQFLPPVPSGKHAGDQWTDTTESTDDLGQGSIATRTVTNFQASSETFAGTSALKVAAAASSSFSGTQNIQGQDAALEGTGTTNAAWYMAPDGSLLGGNFTTTQDLTLTGGFAPSPIPINVKVESTTTLLR
jgi:hypothetical protein